MPWFPMKVCIIFHGLDFHWPGKLFDVSEVVQVNVVMNQVVMLVGGTRADHDQ